MAELMAKIRVRVSFRVLGNHLFYRHAVPPPRQPEISLILFDNIRHASVWLLFLFRQQARYFPGDRGMGRGNQFGMAHSEILGSTDKTRLRGVTG